MKIIKKIQSTKYIELNYSIELETDNILSFCIAYSKSVSGNIEVLFVDEKYRRNGFGLKLMNSAVEWFKEKQVDDIELRVSVQKLRVSFYQKWDYYLRSIIITTKLYRYYENISFK